MTTNILTFVDYGDIKAEVNEDNCDGCAFCLDVCPFKAISVVSNKAEGEFIFQRHVEIDLDLCKGCGLCQGTCPKDAIYVQGFSSAALSKQIEEALAGK